MVQYYIEIVGTVEKQNLYMLADLIPQKLYPLSYLLVDIPKKFTGHSRRKGFKYSGRIIFVLDPSIKSNKKSHYVHFYLFYK